jgi:hypothetical protein
MTYLLAIPLALAIPTLLTLAVLYARAVRQGASERVRAAEAVSSATEVGGKLRASEEQRARLAKAVARGKRRLRELQEYWIRVGDPAAVRRYLDDLLQDPDGDEDGDATHPGPVPDWVTTDPGGGDSDDDPV